MTTIARLLLSAIEVADGRCYALRRRCRIHHGVPGVCLVAAGTALIWSDWDDRAVWLQHLLCGDGSLRPGGQAARISYHRTRAR